MSNKLPFDDDARGALAGGDKHQLALMRMSQDIEDLYLIADQIRQWNQPLASVMEDITLDLAANLHRALAAMDQLLGGIQEIARMCKELTGMVKELRKQQKNSNITP